MPARLPSEGAGSFAIIPNSEIIMAFDKLDIDDGITLTRVRSEDAEEIFALMERCRDYLQEWMWWVGAIESVEDIPLVFDLSEEQYADDYGLLCCIRMQGSIVGMIGLVDRDGVHKTTSLAYWIGEEYQGRGIATKAARALTDYAFSEWNLNRVELWIAKENARCRAVADRLRFRQEGTCREKDSIYGRLVNYAMLRREWTTT